MGRAATSSIQTPREFTRISAWMGPWVRPSALIAASVVRMIAALRGGGLARRRDVDGLFKERAVERIGLVENREHAQLSIREQCLRARIRGLR